MESIVYNQKGEKAGTVALPEAVFGVPFKADLVHQVVFALLSSQRGNTAHTKNRGEVRGGGKKPWRQKGTGRARHGSTRSPIWVGGGVAHGPRNDKNYERKVNKKMKREALLSVLSKKFQDGEVVFLDALILPEIKTAEAKKVLKDLASLTGGTLLKKEHNAAHMVLSDMNEQVTKSFRNFKNISVGEARNLNILDALQYKYLIVVNPEESIKRLIPVK